MPHFMIVLIPYINLLSHSWIKNLFLRNKEPLDKNTNVLHGSCLDSVI